jgi:glycosyltransferase involved in cell wall biosynthesis
MKILLCSVPFRPSVGGIETVSEILAERFQRLGHDVVVVTQTPSELPDAASYRIVRQPRFGAFFDLVAWADIVFHNHISLRLAWPLLVLRRPWVVTHHTWLPRSGPGAAAAWAKRRLLRFAHNVAVSRAVADSLPVACALVPNPYADGLFTRLAAKPRWGDLIFVGRLVDDKGAALLLDALAELAGRGRVLRATVVGEGPEAQPLRERAAALGLGEQLRFAGRRVGADLVDLLNAHPVIVVPSLWEEPFGLVVLEAMACGCVPIAARSGGLPEAVGDCGVLFPKGDVAALAQAMDALCADHDALRSYRLRARAHLARHRPERVAHDYLELFEHARL